MPIEPAYFPTNVPGNPEQDIEMIQNLPGTILITVLSALLAHCTSQDSGSAKYSGRSAITDDCAQNQDGTQPGANNPGGSRLTDCDVGDPTGGKAGSKAASGSDNPFANQVDQDDGVPNFDQANLESRFNREKLKKLKIPDEYNEIKIIAKSVEFYRGIWLDLRKQVWKGFDDFSERFSGSFSSLINDPQVSDYFLDIFDSGDKPKVKKISVWQPLQTPTLLDFAPDMPLTFYLPGHLAVPKIEQPTTKTIVMTPNPFLEGNAAIAPPEDYELIYKKSGEFTEDVLAMCSKIDQDMATGESVLPDIEDQTYCDTILPGTLMGHRTEGGTRVGNYNPYTGTYNNAFDELFKKQSAALWKPIPQAGYKCLGHISTNGKMEKPYTEKDFAQSVVEVGVSERYAMYCVQEEYVVKGKLFLPPLVTDGEITIFRIVSDDPDGFDDANLFYAHKGRPSSEELKKVEVWVLNKKFVKFLPDDTHMLKGTK